MTIDDPTGARLEAAGKLMAAIAACDPRDRAVLLSAVLETLAAGAPGAPFLEIREKAADWAALATPQELEAYLDACGGALIRAPLPTAVRRRIGDRLTGLAEEIAPRQNRGEDHAPPSAGRTEARESRAADWSHAANPQRKFRGLSRS